MKVGDKITLPKGTPVGMGKLKAPAQGTIVKAECREDGVMLYCVRFSDKEERTRYTWIEGEKSEPKPEQEHTDKAVIRTDKEPEPA